MKQTNITAYQEKPEEIQMFYCKCAVRDGYYIENGDESFYRFMGKNTCFSVPELLHPEDVEDFLQAAENIGQEDQHLLLRLKNKENEYRCLYVVLRLNGKKYNGVASFDMELCNLMSITDRYVVYCDLVQKYRKFMTLFQGMFFEYDFKTDIFKIYEYRNSRCKFIYTMELEKIWQEVQGRKDLTGEQKAEFENLFEAVRNGRDNFRMEIDAAVLLKETGKMRYEFRCAAIYKDDVQSMAIGLVQCIGERQQKKRYYLSEQAYDAGTGLLNKRAIYEYATDCFQETTKSAYLAIVDVDDFKKINDTFGHMYGDLVLSRVSEIIRSVLNDRGVAGRFGGDEFMIVFEEIYDEEDLRRVLLTIAKHIRWAFHDVEGISVSLSIGVAKYPEDGENYETLFQKADKALYIAKAKGKSRYIIYDEKKHGTTCAECEAEPVIGLKPTVSEEVKHAAVSDMMLALHTDREKALALAMQQIAEYFDIDGIALYCGKEMKRISSFGSYVKPVMQLPWMFDSVYQEYFDEQGVYAENQILRLKNKCPRAYEQYLEQENGKFIQFALFRDNVPVSVVAFDFFNRAPKYGITDAGLLRILGRMMAEILAEMEV